MRFDSYARRTQPRREKVILETFILGLLSVRCTSFCSWRIVHCSKRMWFSLARGMSPTASAVLRFITGACPLLRPGASRPASMAPSSPSRHLLAPSAVASLRSVSFHGCVSVRKLSCHNAAGAAAPRRADHHAASTLLSPLGHWAVSLGPRSKVQRAMGHADGCPVSEPMCRICRCRA